MASTQKQNNAFQHVPQESILVVKREHLFPHETWNGMRTGNFNRYLNIINSHKEFLPRHEMEQNPAYKQI